MLTSSSCFSRVIFSTAPFTLGVQVGIVSSRCDRRVSRPAQIVNEDARLVEPGVSVWPGFERGISALAVALDGRLHPIEGLRRERVAVAARGSLLPEQL